MERALNGVQPVEDGVGAISPEARGVAESWVVELGYDPKDASVLVNEWEANGVEGAARVLSMGDEKSRGRFVSILLAMQSVVESQGE